MVTFPAWVGHPRTTSSDQVPLACRRLRYMTLMASIQCTERGSIASFADHCELERTEVHRALREGKFSAKMALKIEKACGRDVVRREWLVYPLDITDLSK